MVPKSQIDNSTIDKEIDLKIVAHNADEEAHLAAGQSLQSHKASEIVDHLIGSVLADKMTQTELSIRTAFESLDGYSIVGSVTNDDFPGVRLYVEYGAVNLSSLSTQPQVPINFRNSAKNILFQIFGRFNITNNSYDAWFGLLVDHISTADGFGFVINQGVLKAHVRAGTTTIESGALSVDLSDDHIYRAQNDASSGNVYFYIDNVLVATIAKPTGTWEDDVGPCIGIEVTGDNDGNLFIGELFISRQI